MPCIRRFVLHRHWRNGFYHFPVVYSRVLRRAIVPTVNASSGPAVEKMMRHFLEFMDLSSDRKRLDSYFTKHPSPASGGGSGCGGGLNRTPSAAHTAPSGKRSKIVGRTRGDSPYSAEVSPPAEQIDFINGDARSFKPPPILLDCANARVGDATVCPVAANPYAQSDRSAALLTSPRPLPPREPCGGDMEIVGGGGGGGGGGGDSRHASDATAANSCSTNDSGTTVAIESLLGRKGHGNVEIDLVDVEAQRAIMADIDRRKRHQQQQQQQDVTTATRPLAAVTTKNNQRSGAIYHARPEGPARRKINEPGSGRKQLSAASGGAGSGSSRPTVRAIDISGEGDTKSPDVAGESGGPDATANGSSAGGYGRRALVADNTPVPSTANIRDFFSRRD